MLFGLVVLIFGCGLIAFSLKGRELKNNFNNILAGVAISLIIPAGWYITGVIGFEDFEPSRLESYTFTAPTAEGFMYLMTFTGTKKELNRLAQLLC